MVRGTGFCTLDDNFINIDTRRVTSVDGECPGGADFLTYSSTCINNYMDGFFKYYLPMLFPAMYPDSLLDILASTFSKGWMAYFAGNEIMPPSERNNINTLSQSISTTMVNTLNNIWADLPPKDNKVQLKLK